MLITFLIVTINPIRQIQKAKNAQRQHDISQIINALDTYYSDKNCYPISLTMGAQFSSGSIIYMRKVPQDPDFSNGSNPSYLYQTDTTQCPQWNVLFAKLSSAQDVQTSCPLTQLSDCLPVNYQSLGYNYCRLSGKVDCAYISANPLPAPLFATPTSTPVPTPTPPVPTPTGSGVPLPTPTPVPTSTYSQTILNTTGLVSHWRLGEASGNPQDSKGTNHVTVVGGTPTYGQTGAIVGDSNKAIDFNASADFFTVPDSASLDLGNGPFSIEVWARRDTDTGTWAGAVNKGTNAYAVALTNTDDKWELGMAGVTVLAKESGTTPANGTWHHFVVTRTNSTTMKVYKDGVDVTTLMDTSRTLQNTASVLEIGREGTTARLGGALDELAIYNVVLSAATVLDHYNKGVAPSTPTPTPTAAPTPTPVPTPTPSPVPTPTACPTYYACTGTPAVCNILGSDPGNQCQIHGGSTACVCSSNCAGLPCQF